MSLEYGVEEITMVLRERLFLAGFERALEREKERDTVMERMWEMGISSKKKEEEIYRYKSDVDGGVKVGQLWVSVNG